MPKRYESLPLTLVTTRNVQSAGFNLPAIVQVSEHALNVEAMAIFREADSIDLLN